MTRLKAIHDRTGKRYGRLTMIKLSHTDRWGAYWICKCDCGKEVIVNGSSAKKGNTRSCGCLKKSHGFFGTKFYNKWTRLNARCNDKNSPSYKYYGARGIKVCKRWRKFENFRDDMYESFLEHQRNNKYTSIERIDNNGDYCKENCKWATIAEQNRNKRDTHLITFKGKTQCLKDWSTEVGITRYALESRIKMGWTIKDALTKPIKTKHFKLYEATR